MTSPRGIPSYCGSSPLPQAMCVCSYQMQITFPTLLAESLTPQDPSPVFFSPARFAMLCRVHSPSRFHLPLIWLGTARWLWGRYLSNPPN